MGSATLLPPVVPVEAPPSRRRPRARRARRRLSSIVLPVRPPLAQRRQPDARPPGRHCAPQAQQHRVRADLQEDVAPSGLQRLHRRPRSAPAPARAAPSTRRRAPLACTACPVTFETSAICGAPYRTPAATFSNAASIGSISGEWNACDTRSAVLFTPCSAELRADRPHRLPRPRDHHALGPVDRRQIDTDLAYGASAARTRSASANTAAIAPPAGSACISRPRAAIKRQPVLQREHPRHARRHVLPHAVAQHRRRLDPPTPPQRGQRVLQREQRRLRVRRSCRAAPRPPPPRTAPPSSGRSRCGSQQLRASLQRLRRNAGCVSYSSRPIPTYCEPWPVNRNATVGAESSRRPRPAQHVPACVPPAASASKPLAQRPPLRQRRPRPVRESARARVGA